MGVQEAQASKQTVLHVALGGQRWAAGIQRDRQGHVSQEENHRGGCAHLLFKGQVLCHWGSVPAWLHHSAAVKPPASLALASPRERPFLSLPCYHYLLLL